MSVPVDPAMAVGGRLAAGDRIDVLFTDHSVASVIVTDAKVLAVDERGRGGIGESSSPFTVTIAVNASESLLVAAAIVDGNISIARTTGAASSLGTAPQSIGRATTTTTTRVPGAR
jgi:Flp pilus assembly protein CpaB